MYHICTSYYGTCFSYHTASLKNVRYRIKFLQDSFVSNEDINQSNLKKEKVKDTYVATIDTNTKNKQEATRLPDLKYK